MRRHDPRDSPNSTRELGPIDATTRDSLLGPVRTTTQWRDTVRTHGFVRRVGDAGAAGATDFVAGGTTGEAFGTETRGTVSTAATVGVGVLSSTAANVRAFALSLSAGAATAAGRVVTDRERGVCCKAPPRSSSTATITEPTAPLATYQTRGAIGGRVGCVPHHRHDPTLSG